MCTVLVRITHVQRTEVQYRGSYYPEAQSAIRAMAHTTQHTRHTGTGREAEAVPEPIMQAIVCDTHTHTGHRRSVTHEQARYAFAFGELTEKFRTPL